MLRSSFPATAFGRSRDVPARRLAQAIRWTMAGGVLLPMAWTAILAAKIG
jgi:hypothetical protein